ncbi:MAG: mechanosensitive ion channel family protein [Gammaproteobacteria bacterium]
MVTYAAAIYFRNDNPYFELLFLEILKALIMLRLWMILLRNIFSPNRPTLRPIPLDDESSGQLHRWFIAFFVIIEFGNALFVYLTRAGMSEAELNGFLIPYTLSLNLIILSRVWKMRKKITAMFVNPGAEAQQQSFAREVLYTAWPFAFTAWLLSLWMMWLYKAFLGSWEEAGYISISWWITLAFFVADRIFYGLIKNVGNIEWLQSPTYAMRSSRFIKITLNGFRLLMVAVAVYMFSLAWGFAPGAIMQSSLTNKLLGHGINLLAIATFTYIVWEFFNALIERKLPSEADALATLEGEGGGAGATRAETLLPLMRTLLTVILVTFVILSVLHSLGIAITPLLAGAGVVGIAIGFGAQKLVQDVLSGIFFLVDDAFRKSEYIEIENLRGTVEKISLRSMQLRHHLGAVQTIPYGEIKTVKNLSRDWITMKLELRLSYDTDIEQVRKIIKKVGQSMLEDPELGPCFILPLKSQGVMRVEESALIVRMKFTTKPGQQWVVRREAYRRVRDALAEAGIFFAHREVRVRLPDDINLNELPDKTGAIKDALASAGAAAGSVAAQEAQKRDRTDFENDT